MPVKRILILDDEPNIAGMNGFATRAGLKAGGRQECPPHKAALKPTQARMPVLQNVC
jgi:hypothetical protein